MVNPIHPIRTTRKSGLFNKDMTQPMSAVDFNKFFKLDDKLPELKDLNFSESEIKVKSFTLSILNNYAFTRDLPSEDATSHLGPHLRFGTVSIRSIIRQLRLRDDIFLSELIW